MIAIMKIFIESKVPVRNFNILSQHLRVESLIDSFNPHFASLGHKRAPMCRWSVFFSKSGRWCGFKYILVISKPSKIESGLVLPKKLRLCAGLTWSLYFLSFFFPVDSFFLPKNTLNSDQGQS